MSVSYISALFHADDDNGAPLIGGKLYTYLNGTTTPATTYQDAGGATPNTNPIVLNSRGEAKVFVTAGTLYTFALYTSAGTLVWTQDAIDAPLSVSALSPYAPLASPALTGNPTAPTQTAGNNSTRLATTAFVATAVSSVSVSVAPTACRLAVSGGNLVLSRFNGARLTIDGVPQAIPSAGVSLAPTGVTPSTAYYVYAYMSSGTMTLEFSVTAPAIDSTTGIKIKTSDSTRTLVGQAYANGSSAWSIVRSWFNDPGFVVSNKFTAERQSTLSASYTEINSEIRCPFLCWSGEVITVAANGTIRIDTGSSDFSSSISIDGTTQDVYMMADSYGINANIPLGQVLKTASLAEGYHYATIIGASATAYGYYAGGATAGLRTTLQVSSGTH